MKRAGRAVDGSKQLTDEERLKVIDKAFKECGFKYTPKQVEEQFFYETGRKPTKEQ